MCIIFDMSLHQAGRNISLRHVYRHLSQLSRFKEVLKAIHHRPHRLLQYLYYENKTTLHLLMTVASVVFNALKIIYMIYILTVTFMSNNAGGGIIIIISHFKISYMSCVSVYLPV